MGQIPLCLRVRFKEFGFLSPPAPRAYSGRTRVALPGATRRLFRHPSMITEDLSAFGQCGIPATISLIGCLSGCNAIVRQNAPDARRQFSDVSVAPIIAPGCWELPFWRMTATESTPSNLMAPTGTVNVSLLPFQVPSLIQRRTTLV
jgi:hypothetical protein